MTASTATANRAFQRRRIIKGGTIAYSDRRLTIPCVVRDIAEAGAKLKVNRIEEVPDTFDLIIDLDGFESSCIVVWRKDREIGVRFVTEPVHRTPGRLQVVEPSFTAPQRALREDARRKREHREEIANAYRKDGQVSGTEADLKPVVPLLAAVDDAGRLQQLKGELDTIPDAAGVAYAVTSSEVFERLDGMLAADPQNGPALIVLDLTLAPGELRILVADIRRKLRDGHGAIAVVMPEDQDGAVSDAAEIGADYYLPGTASGEQVAELLRILPSARRTA